MLLSKLIYKYALVTLMSISSFCKGANILAVEPLPVLSHWKFMRTLLLNLVKNGGHNVTVFTPFASSSFNDNANYTEIDLRLNIPLLRDIDFKTDIINLIDVWQYIPMVTKANNALVCTEIDKLPLTSKYDLFLVELISSECVSHLSRVLDLPLVYISPTPMGSWMDDQVLGTFTHPSYIARLFARYRSPTSFSERIDNIYNQALIRLLYWLYEPAVDNVKPSIIFVNSHEIVEKHYPRPNNVILVGGINLPISGTLPLDILEFIENSPCGVIYFTFGSIVAMSTLPEKIEKAFKEAIAQLPQRVLWKYEGEMKDKPTNVMTKKWFPQRDILLHPKVKLFISHGGISGMYEAVDAGIPVLGFPIFYDQPRNMANLVDIGMAISMDLFSVTKETLFDAINKIINDETYTKNAKEISIQFKDRHMSPAETVVYWTNYVIRHKGAPHLKLQALKLSWYQFFLLDVISVIVFPLLFILYILFKLNRIFFRDIKKFFKIKQN